MIPVILWARLELFAQFSVHLYTYAWFWSHYFMPNPDFRVRIMASDFARCDPDVFCYICGCFTTSKQQKITDIVKNAYFWYGVF